MKDIRQRLLATFQVEHQDHLKCMRDILARTGDSLAGPDLDEIFRRAHSLKGAARAVGLQPIEDLAHRLETLFSQIRSGTAVFDSKVAGTVKAALDSSEDLLADLSENKATAIPETAKETLAAEPTAPAFQPLETVRLLARNLDRLVNSAGQLSTENLRQDLLAQKLEHLDKHLKETLTDQVRMRKAAAQAFRTVDTTPELAGVARYSEYLEHRTRALSEEIRSMRQLHDRNSWALRSLTSELQTEARQARMTPAESVFESFPKMVRDLAREEGKSAELLISGGDVQADRVVLQALKDPLMHALRNALSHGIESDEERKTKGKTAPPRIWMKIEAQGNRLNVVVEDNGCGLNLARIGEIAVRQGLITEADVASYSREDLARLVFLPGFSTSSSVTSVSGRGMGLSVVAETVARLQGKVEIQPNRADGGSGARITMSVPLSISSHRLLLVLCQGQTFAIPLQGVERLYRVSLKSIETVEGKPMVRVEGRLVSLVSLAHLLNIAEAAVSADSDTLSVAVLKLGERRLAVAVDTFLSEREAVIKDLPPAAAANTRLAGGILLEDGSVCLVLNTADIVGSFKQTGNSLVIKTASEERVERSSRILIVDDSLTTRTLEKSILEAKGYDVAVAVDGVEALDYLRSMPVGLVVTDLEMPRMDGFGLLAEIKNDPRLAKIPVIIVSSLENREHQERGLSLGADAYIVKKRFEQRDLLETIEQIL